MRTIITALLIAAGLAGCAAKQEIEPAEIPQGSHVCIAENPAVRAGFLVELKKILDEKNIDYIVTGIDSARDCEWHVTYVARWSWDVALYMTYAEIKVFHYGRLDGTALYDGTFAINKFIDSEPKIRELVNQLIQERKESAEAQAAPEVTVTEINDISPRPEQTYTVTPGETVLRARHYFISTSIRPTDMWSPDAAFVIDAIAWPEFSGSPDDIFIASGTKEWKGQTYYRLGSETGPFSWGVADRAYLLLAMDGTFDGIMSVETGTFRTKIEQGPKPVPFTQKIREVTRVGTADNYTNLEVIFLNQTPDGTEFSVLTYTHDAGGQETLVSNEKRLVTDGTYSIDQWQIEILSGADNKLRYRLLAATSDNVDENSKTQ
jgi:hypothetical protein